MYKTKKSGPLLGVTMLLSSLGCGARDTTDRVCDAAVVIGAGAAVFGIGAAIWGALKPARPEDVLRDAYNTRDRAQQSLEYAIVQKYNLTHSGSYSESLLHQLAVARVHSQCAGLSSFISEINAAQKAIGDARCRTQNHCLRHDLDNVGQHLQALESSLLCLERCLSGNSAYFDLFELEERIRAYYARELGIDLNSDARDCTIDARQDLYRCLSLRGSRQQGWKYPYLECAKKIAADSRHLEKFIARAGYTYSARLREAHNLLASLKVIEHLVLTDHEYTASLRAYEHEQRERERLELERQRFALEKERMRLEQTRLQVERDCAWVQGCTRACRVCGVRENVGCCCFYR